MTKWNTGELDQGNDTRRDRWEYARFLFNWQQDFMEVGENKRVHWAEAWNMFDRMGEDGWEMITLTPISTSLQGHGAGDTNHLLIVLKRRKAAAARNN